MAVGLGFIGVGGRGSRLLSACLMLDDVEIPAVCDVVDQNANRAANLIEESGKPRPETYSDHRRLLERDDIGGVVIASPWDQHTSMSLDAMRAGKYAAPEVWGVSSVEECWQLVRTAEETGAHCMMLENACYDRTWMTVLNMVRQDLFGELVHCQCGYQHDLRGRIIQGKGTGTTAKGEGDFRTMYNEKRNADVYPTHGIGPVSKYLNIHKGNRFLTLTSMASKSVGLRDWARKNLDKDDPAIHKSWAIGDVIDTMIKCTGGETVVISHDCCLPRPYSRMGRVQGTDGLWMEDNKSVYVEGRSPSHAWEPFETYQAEYEHPIWGAFLEEGVRGGHGGSDYLTLRAFADSVRDQTTPPIDTYDTAAWAAITALSEESIALGSAPVAFPDFTCGRWMGRGPDRENKMTLD